MCKVICDVADYFCHFVHPQLAVAAEGLQKRLGVVVGHCLSFLGFVGLVRLVGQVRMFLSKLYHCGSEDFSWWVMLLMIRLFIRNNLLSE